MNLKFILVYKVVGAMSEIIMFVIEKFGLPIIIILALSVLVIMLGARSKIFINTKFKYAKLIVYVVLEIITAIVLLLSNLIRVSNIKGIEIRPSNKIRFSEAITLDATFFNLKYVAKIDLVDKALADIRKYSYSTQKHKKSKIFYDVLLSNIECNEISFSLETNQMIRNYIIKHIKDHGTVVNDIIQFKCIQPYEKLALMSNSDIRHCLYKKDLLKYLFRLETIYYMEIDLNVK